MRALSVLLLIALPAHAYNEALHAFITRRALAHHVVGEAGKADVTALRLAFWKLASKHPEFRARFPSPDTFGAWELKELLMLDPAATVHGFDETNDIPLSRLLLDELASRWPDDDRRNQHRYLRDPVTHAIVPAADGTATPYDPATLDFGSLTGTTSQAHAHYGLVDGPLSDDPDVLKKDPPRFAVPKTAHAYAREMAQIYTDLASLAAANHDPALVGVFAGAALHHLEDVCNQIHTVQVGIYDFFESAFLQSKLRDVTTLGGLFGERRTLRQIGIRLIANHHLLSEDLFAKRVLSGQVQLELTTDDPQVHARGPRAGWDLASKLIALSSVEAAEVYRLTWKFSAPTLRKGDGHEYDGEHDDPEKFIEQGAPEIAEFEALEARGAKRAATAVRAWMMAFAQEKPDGQAAVDRILAIVLPYHREAARRRAAYVPAQESRAGIAWGYPAAAAVLLCGAAALVVHRRRR